MINHCFPIRRLIGISLCSILLIGTVYSQSGWEKKIIDSTRDFKRIQFVNSQTGFVSDGSACIYKTTDSGNNWNKILELNAVSCEGMCFPDSVTGYLSVTFTNPVRSYIYKTTNGGNNFLIIAAYIGGSMPNLYFYDNLTGWYYGYFSLYKTTNGGLNWSVIPIRNSFINQIIFLNQTTGYYLSLDRLMKSSNEGYIWGRVLSSDYYLNNLFLYDANTGYIAGNSDSGLIIKTTDGGFNWNRVFSTSEFMRKIQFLNVKTGYALGEASRIFKTTDEGSTWIAQNLEPNYIYFDFCFSNAFTGWVAGERGIGMRTTNGGTIFVNKLETKIPENFSLYQNYPNPFNPITKIKFDIPTQRVIARSGATWQSLMVSLKIFDLLGKEIQTLVNEQLNPGIYEAIFDGSNLPSGIYFYQLKGANFSVTKMMTLVK